MTVSAPCSAACTKPEPESEAISRSLAISARNDTDPVPMPTSTTSRPYFSNSLVSLANHNGATAPSVEPYPDTTLTSGLPCAGNAFEVETQRKIMTSDAFSTLRPLVRMASPPIKQHPACMSPRQFCNLPSLKQHPN